jgi:hypothetical protein
MSFNMKRRQQFLDERHDAWMRKDCTEGIANIEQIIDTAIARSDGAYAADRMSFSALLRFQRLVLDFTAGAPVEAMREELERVVVAYERYGQQLWENTQDRNEPVFQFDVLDEYPQLLQLIGLCFLLHRRDLLPRLAALQDGLDAVGQKGQGTGGSDWIYEEFMSFAVGPENRFESERIHWPRPYEPLADALSSADNAAALKDLDRFLKRWYKDLAGTGWHDSHKPDEHGNQGGYYGYWSFEAGAAVLLLGIEDDSSLHKYLYYPKDLVAWARAHQQLSATEAGGRDGLRCEAGQPCPRAGYWFTPARLASRQRFEQGQVMPEVGSPYGATIWQWDSMQA